MGEITRERVLRAATEEQNFSNLARRLGEQAGEAFERMVEGLVPGIGYLLRQNECVVHLREAVLSHDYCDSSIWRVELLKAIDNRLQRGLKLLGQSVLFSPPSLLPVEKKIVKKAVTKLVHKKKATPLLDRSDILKTNVKMMKGVGMETVDETKLKPVDVKLVESEPMRPYVVGTTGEKFCGRLIVVVRKVGGIFGTKASNRERLERFTIHNGIINHCDIPLGGEPSPYWAILDAASDLKERFTKEQVIERAMTTLGNRGERKACSIAWDVLKTHIRHKSKRNVGMSHMIDHIEGRHLMSIRGRQAHETLAYFMGEQSSDTQVTKVENKPRKVVAKKDEVVAIVSQNEIGPGVGEEPLKTVVLQEPL